MSDLANVLGGLQMLPINTTEEGIANIQLPFYTIRSSKGYNTYWQNIVGIKNSFNDYYQIYFPAQKSTASGYHKPMFRHGEMNNGSIVWDNWDSFA